MDVYLLCWRFLYRRRFLRGGRRLLHCWLSRGFLYRRHRLSLWSSCLFHCCCLGSGYFGFLRGGRLGLCLLQLDGSFRRCFGGLHSGLILILIISLKIVDVVY